MTESTLLAMWMGRSTVPIAVQKASLGAQQLQQKILFLVREVYIYNQERDDNIRISSTNVITEGEYYTLSEPISFITTFYRGSAECNKYKVDTMSTSDRLFITEIDTINWIIAGEFNFTGFNECTGNPVEVTNGKFRLNYTY